MDKKADKLNKIRENIKNYVNREKEARRAIEDRTRQEKADRERALKIYNNWVKKHKTKAIGAVSIIWHWYEQFIVSQIFKELVEALKLGTNNHDIRISKVIECSRPSHVHVNTFWGERQLLTIDSSGKLFVHNCVKYGKSYPINQKEDFFKYIELPVLIEVARTITDESIWEIINLPD